MGPGFHLGMPADVAGMTLARSLLKNAQQRRTDTIQWLGAYSPGGIAGWDALQYPGGGKPIPTGQRLNRDQSLAPNAPGCVSMQIGAGTSMGKLNIEPCATLRLSVCAGPVSARFRELPSCQGTVRHRDNSNDSNRDISKDVSRPNILLAMSDD